MQKLIFLSLVVVSLMQNAFSFECPGKIIVLVKGFSSLSPDNDSAIEAIYNKGEKQTSIAYIKEVLKVAKSLTTISDTLLLNKKESKASGGCVYKGNQAALTITAKNTAYGKYIAKLLFGNINYHQEQNDGGNIVSHVGKAIKIVNSLKDFNKSFMSKDKREANKMILDLLIQWSEGFGTDGITVDAEIGRATTVTYVVVK